MLKKLDVYVLKELLAPFLVGTVSVVLMFLANTLIAYAREIFAREVPPSAVAQLLLFKIPSTLNLTLPVGITIACAFAMSRLVRESELTAIRAAGIPVRRVMMPMLGLGLAVSLFSFWLGDQITPKSEQRALSTLRKVFASAQAIGIQSNVLLKLNNGEYHVSIGDVQKGAGGKAIMNDILVVHRPKRNEQWLIIAETGSYSDGILTLLRPVLWRCEGPIVTSFDVKQTYVLNQRFSLDDFFGTPLPEEQSAAQLYQAIQKSRERGGNTRSEEVDFHNKFSVPAACFVFALFAPVLALHFARGGAFVGVLLNIIIVFLYYNIWVLSAQILAKGGYLPPLVGAWLPNALFFAAGVVALWRSE